MSGSGTPAPRKAHVLVAKGDLPRYVLLPGDPARVPLIGRGWSSYEEVSNNREFRVGRGKLDGVALGACSTGIGGPSTDIAAVELHDAGVDTFIRVGTCAALQADIACGSLVISSGALRRSGAADAYVDAGYPAVADHAVTLALIEAAESLGAAYTVGISASVDSFFAGQDNPPPTGYRPSHFATLIDDLRQQRVANVEMEAATLFVLAGLMGFRAGCVCAVASNRATRERRPSEASVEMCAAVASKAVVLLAMRDAAAAQAGKRFWYPGL
ncbi:MAG: nucleoside phosphorylase [Magnetospirillum sp.]|nr:nucleoside phosphorylase [Magnetospirillum sp.]